MDVDLTAQLFNAEFVLPLLRFVLPLLPSAPCLVLLVEAIAADHQSQDEARERYDRRGD